jgi:RNA 3'-terminal phosphate cyclase
MRRNDRTHQRGFVSVGFTMCFVAIASGVILSLSMQTKNAATLSHLGFLRTQAETLANGAIEKAIAQLQSNNFATEQSFTIQLYPVTVQAKAGQAQAEQLVPAVTAEYSYTIEETESINPDLTQQGREFYKITGAVTIPFRNKIITQKLQKLCYQKTNNRWHAVPIIP